MPRKHGQMMRSSIPASIADVEAIRPLLGGSSSGRILRSIKLLNNVAGPVANWTASYTPGPGVSSIILFGSFAGFQLVAGATKVDVALSIDTVQQPGSVVTFLYNNTGEHLTPPTLFFGRAALAAGAHTIALVAGTGNAGFQADGNDFANLVLLELS